MFYFSASELGESLRKHILKLYAAFLSPDGKVGALIPQYILPICFVSFSKIFFSELYRHLSVLLTFHMINLGHFIFIPYNFHFNYFVSVFKLMILFCFLIYNEKKTVQTNFSNTQ